MALMEKGMVLENTYEIVEEIGAGGGGVVFRAKHLRLQTDVVVKKIKDEVRGRVKSRQEADILKNLKHPCLPRVYDFIETEDGVYTVMDFIHGDNLDVAVKKHGRYSQKQVKKWAEQLGGALDYLHSQTPPIIHSDIKPANIMLTQEGDVCLIDFNISLAMGESMESAVGISAGFSPPEQYRDPALYARITHNYTLQKSIEMRNTGKGNEDDRTELLPGNEGEKTELLPGSEGGKTELLQGNEAADTPFEYVKYIGKGIDARSDIYSLGVTLYYLLTGIEPPADFAQRIPIGETNVPVSEGFAIILEKMMELSREDRYQNGGAFLKAVQNCHKLDHRYVMMHRRQTVLQAGALVSMTLGIFGIFIGLYQMRREENSQYYGLLQQAQEAMNLYDYEEADALLEDAKALSETRIEAYEQEVRLLYLNENYEECVKLGENYINTMPFQMKSGEDEKQLGDIYYIVGNAYFELEDYPNARNLFEQALERNNGNGLYYRDYAITLAKLGLIMEAEKQLERGIAMEISQDSVYMAQGEIACVKGELNDAVEYLYQTITLTDDAQLKKRAVLLCAEMYQTIGIQAADREISLLEQYAGELEGKSSLVISERLADAYVRKAQADESQADAYYQKAIALFNTIYEKGYVTYQLQENRAILYEDIDDFERAQDILLKMTQDYPQRYEPYKRLAYLEADRQQMKENAGRDYTSMQEYYEKAKELYAGKEQDMEMDMLEQMMQELKDGGWL